MWKWTLSLMICRGKHRYMMHFLSEKKVWECTRCGRIFPIPESLIHPSGSFKPKAPEQPSKDGMDPQEKSSNVGEPLIMIRDAYQKRKKGA